MTKLSEPSTLSRAAGTMSGSMDSMEKMIPSVDEITFWLLVNVVLFLYVGIFQLVNRYGPGTYLSAGAILLGIIYLLLWMISKTNKKMGHQWIMLISGLAVLGDLVVIAVVNGGSFSGTSALLDFAGIMLFRATYKESKHPV
jgi:O-antigen/teichoic acid export membrane protein